MSVQLNRKLTLEEMDRVPDGAGGFSDIWMPLGTVWGDVSSRSGTDRGGAVATMSVVACRIVVRAAPVGSSMRPRAGQRFREGARLFVIEAVAEKDSGARYLVCFATEERVT